MKHTFRIIAFGFCFSLFLGVCITPRVHAEEYYIYRDANGKLVISNQLPPRGSTILKQQTLPDISANQEPSLQEHDDTPREHSESPPESPKNK